MRECGGLSTTTLAQTRRLGRPRHLYAVPRTFLQCVCTRRRNCIGQLSPFWEYAPAARQINPNASAQTHSHHFAPAGAALRPSWSYLRAGAAAVWRVDPAPNDPALLAPNTGATACPAA